MTSLFISPNRKTKASNATRILIHLVSAMCLLNFTFLINNFVANMKNSVGCKIMAALMHYFMLATFTWFAVQAFHLCLQIYTGGQIVIRRYILKVSIVSWGEYSTRHYFLLFDLNVDMTFESLCLVGQFSFFHSQYYQV